MFSRPAQRKTMYEVCVGYGGRTQFAPYGILWYLSLLIMTIITGFKHIETDVKGF
jgi:hypothetical protein